MRHVRLIVFILLPFLMVGCGRPPTPAPVIVEAEPTIGSLINTFIDGQGNERAIPFTEVIAASCGTRVLPIDPNDEIDSLMLDELARALNETLHHFNAADKAKSKAHRVNDLSHDVEKKILKLLNAAPGFVCDYARNRSGNLQRAGYPDLRWLHEESGRVIYLGTKLVEQDSFNSSLRTFYFTPRGHEGKVLDDASHLMIGIEHDGNVGKWTFENWHAVDLARFKVRLKAEFQASNREIYQSELIIRKSENAD